MVLLPRLPFSSPLKKNDFGERLLLKWILLLETALEGMAHANSLF